MNIKNKILSLLSFGLIAGVVFATTNPVVEATNETFRTFYGCTALTTAQKSDIDKNYNAYVSAMGIPHSITAGGRSQTLNKTYMLNDCLVIYGSPSTVQGQVTSTSGKPLFLGYDRNGTKFADTDENTWDPNQYYFRDQRVVKNPWLSGAKDPSATHTLATSISRSSVKPATRTPSYASPRTVDGKTLTRVQEMARVNDYIYWKNSNRSLGKIGYLDKVNNYSKVRWSPSVLSDHASVEIYPSDYTFGYLNVYTYAPSIDVYFYSNHIIPAHKKALRELEANLKIEITSVASTTVGEGEQTRVNYRITNDGQMIVANPIMTYHLSNKVDTSITHSVSLGAGQSVTGHFYVRMPQVSANKTEELSVWVNKAKNNPSREKTFTDNVAKQNLGVVNATTGGGLTVTTHTPTYPRSNQDVTVTYRICNTGTKDMTNVTTSLKWPRSSAVPGATFGTIGGMTVTYNPTTKVFTTTPGECRTLSSVIKAPETGEIERTTTVTVTSSNGLSGTRPVTVRNPNAMLKITNHKQGTNIQERELGDLKATVTNQMFRNITENCSVGGCTTSPESTTFNIRFFDVTGTTPVEITAARYTSTYNITHGTQREFPLTASKAAIMNYIKNKGENITKIRVLGYIPYYTGEYNLQGMPAYADNKEDFVIQYLPPRPDVANAACELVQHPSASHLNTNGGPSLVKACMGHFPNNPSTVVERGMQSYNYVLYRFHPLPLPNYDVYSPELNDRNPNYFYQLINVPNDNKVKGSDSSYIFKNSVGGAFQERGRYLPDTVNFSFSIKKMEKDASGNETANPGTVAAGNVSYTIPDTCYDTNSLDMKYHYGCGEIMMFLPNTTANMFKEPSNYNQSDIDNRNINYPIVQTKVPYLNPGKYRFALQARETYQYYRQVNQSYDAGGYNWSSVR